MVVGETKPLDIKNLDKGFTWESQYKSVAVVSENGEIVAKASGKTDLTVKSGGNEYQFVVIVKDGNGSKEENADETSEDKDAGKKTSDDGKKSDTANKNQTCFPSRNPFKKQYNI